MLTDRSIVLGTRNAKKRRELEELLRPLGIQLHTLDEFETSIEVAETGTTFAENSALKATEQAKAIGRWVLAEDSGLIVDALQGAPGVYSARFAGEHATDAENNRKLIESLQGVPKQERTAHYVCHMSLAAPSGAIVLTAEGQCHGRIRETPVGTSGFGYDPLFEIIEYHRTFGELGSHVKHVLSHRSRAMRALLRGLSGIIPQETSA